MYRLLLSAIECMHKLYYLKTRLTVNKINLFYVYRWQTRIKPKGFKNLFALIFCAGHIIGNIVFTVFLLSAAIKNYPGGHAITLLHTLESNNLEANYTIHIDNLAAQTGITRFTQLSDHWT